MISPTTSPGVLARTHSERALETAPSEALEAPEGPEGPEGDEGQTTGNEHREI